MSSMLETGSEGPKKSRVRSESIVIRELGVDTSGNDLGGGCARVMVELNRCETCYRVSPTRGPETAHKILDRSYRDFKALTAPKTRLL